MKYFLALFLLVSLTVEAKPNVEPDKILTKEEQVVVKEYLEGKIFKELQPAKNDYISYVDRGTVKFNSKKGTNILGREVFEASNYSFHKLVIPDGTVVNEVNFTQREPHTVAITGKNLTFVNCNLVNVEKGPSWTLISCNNAQIKRILISDIDNGDTHTLTISHRVEKEGLFTEVDRYEEIISANDYTDAIARFNAE